MIVYWKYVLKTNHKVFNNLSFIAREIDFQGTSQGIKQDCLNCRSMSCLLSFWHHIKMCVSFCQVKHQTNIDHAIWVFTFHSSQIQRKWNWWNPAKLYENKAPKKWREKEIRGKNQSPSKQIVQKKQATRKWGNH